MAGFLSLLLGLLQALPALAAVRTMSESGRPIYWPTPTVAFAGNPINSSGLSDSDVQTMLAPAFNAWMVSGSRVQTSYSQDDHNTVGSDYDGINAVYFASNASRTLDSNIVALTEVLYYVNSGQIAEADMVFNDNDFRFTTTNGSTGTTSGSTTLIYLRDVATHEAGHALGLDHTTVNLSSMFYMAYSGQYALSDDEATIMTSIYPDAATAATGKIVGTVQGRAGGVFGTQVSAINLSTGRVQAAVLANPDGTFRLTGLPNASYSIFMEPFLTSVSTLSSYYQNVDHRFCGASSSQKFKRGFYGPCGSQSAAVVAVSGGGTVNVNTVAPSCNTMSGAPANSFGDPLLTRPVTPGAVAISARGAVHGVLTDGNSDFYILRDVTGVLKARAISYTLFSQNNVRVNFLDPANGLALSTSVTDVDTNKPGGGTNYDSSNQYIANHKDVIVEVKMENVIGYDKFPAGFTMRDNAGFYLLSLSVDNDFGAAAPIDMSACANDFPNKLQSAYFKQAQETTVDTGGGCGTLGGPGSHGGGPGGGLTLLFTSACLLQGFFLAKRFPRPRLNFARRRR